MIMFIINEVKHIIANHAKHWNRKTRSWYNITVPTGVGQSSKQDTEAFHANDGM